MVTTGYVPPAERYERQQERVERERVTGWDRVRRSYRPGPSAVARRRRLALLAVEARGRAGQDAPGSQFEAMHARRYAEVYARRNAAPRRPAARGVQVRTGAGGGRGWVVHELPGARSVGHLDDRELRADCAYCR